ncbi:MAG: hypothetical protein Kow0074_17600 [Candidatus Zixiibacteriota bacterium]
MRHARLIALLVIMLSLAALTSSVGAQSQPKDVVQEYIANLIHEEWAAAEGMWHHDDLRRSERLGMIYLGAPLKIDCVSPLIPLLNGVRSGDVMFGYGEVTVSDSVAVVPIRIRAGVDAIEHRYHLLQTSEGWKLISPLTAYARSWDHRDTRYARVFYADSSLLNDHALAELDRFVERIAGLLEIFDDDLRHLQNLKLEYYLCNEEQIKQITGYAVHGMTSLPMDAIVTRHLPHYHELVHVLTNYRLRQVPLHTLPIVQEGLAVALGGRWEKSADVLLQFGAFMLEQNLVNLDSVLTGDGFQLSAGSLDLSYAAGGLLARWLITSYGAAKFLHLYQRLSTPDTELNEWDAGHIQHEISRMYQMPWWKIVAAVGEFAAANGHGRLHPGAEIPSGDPVVSLPANGTHVNVWESGDAYVFEINAASDHPNVAILFRDKSEPVSTTYESRMFARHLPDVPYDQSRLGLIVTNAEAGLYDYYTNNLIEKYVLSFDPSDEYWDAGAKRIRLRLEKGALPGALAEYELSVRAIRP